MQGSITWLLVVAVITTEAVLQFFLKKNLELKENKKNLKKKKKKEKGKKRKQRRPKSLTHVTLRERERERERERPNWGLKSPTTQKLVFSYWYFHFHMKFSLSYWIWKFSSWRNTILTLLTWFKGLRIFDLWNLTSLKIPLKRKPRTHCTG